MQCIDSRNIQHAVVIGNDICCTTEVCEECDSGKVTLDVLEFNGTRKKFQDIRAIFTSGDTVLVVCTVSESTQYLSKVIKNDMLVCTVPSFFTTLVSTGDSCFYMFTFEGEVFFVNHNQEASTVSSVSVSGLSLKDVTSACLMPDGRIAVVQGFPNSCVNLLYLNDIPQMSLVGRQAYHHSMVVDGKCDEATFSDLACCACDSNGSLFVLDNTLSVESRIRVVLPDLSVHTVFSSDIRLSSICLRNEEIIATASKGIYDMQGLFTLHNKFVKAKCSIAWPLQAFSNLDTPVRTTKREYVTLANLNVLKDQSPVIKASTRWNSPIEEFVIDSSFECASALIHILYNPITSRYYTTELIFDVYLLSDFYQMQVVLQACRYELIRRILSGDAFRVIAMLQQHSNMCIEALEPIHSFCSLLLKPVSSISVMQNSEL